MRIAGRKRGLRNEWPNSVSNPLRGCSSDKALQAGFRRNPVGAVPVEEEDDDEREAC
jgi:hypothetical protein